MIPLRKSRQVRAQKSRSVVKTLPAPTGGWNARDVLSAMPPTDAVALVNWFPETTDVILRYGSELWNVITASAAGNALLLDGVSGYATTPDAAAIDVAGDIDLRAYANLDDWTTSSPQFFIAKGTPGTDASYQFFILEGRLGAIAYTAAGVIAGAYLSDLESLVPATNEVALWVRVTIDIDNGVGFSVAIFYTSVDGTTWTQLGGACIGLSFAAIANSATALELGSGIYPASITYNNPPLLTCDSASFDGVNDYMRRGAGLTGAADSKTGILSAWVRLDGFDGSAMHIFDGSTSLAGADARVIFSRGAPNKFVIATDGGSTLSMQTVATYTSSATWRHVLASWNMAIAGARYLYINDVSDIDVFAFVDASNDYTLGDWSTGARPDGGIKLNGCLAELYFAPGQYLDFSVITNRRKFISASGKPVQLGSTGSLPTGTAPLVYQHLADAEAPANFALNRGTGGNFTITGALTTGTTSPSD